MFKRSLAAGSQHSPAAFDTPATRKRQKLATDSSPAPAGPDNVKEQGRELLNAIENLADQKSRAIAFAFLKLPPKKLYPDYYNIIKKPMALDVIRANLDEGEYVTLDLMRDDLLQMTNNAKRYNQKGSQLYSDASQIARVVKNWSGNPEAYSEDSEPEVYTAEMNAKTVRNLLNATIRDILQKLRDATEKGRSISEFFLELPDKKLYPDYYTIIKRPLSINFIANKMRKNPFTKLSKFEADLEEMYENAFTFNDKSSDVAQDARALKKVSDKLIAQARPEMEKQERELSMRVASPVTRTPLPKAKVPETPSTINTGGFKIKLGLRQPSQTPASTKVKLNLSARPTSSLSRVAKTETPVKTEAARSSPAPLAVERVASPAIPQPVSSPALEPTITYTNTGTPLITQLSLAAPQIQPPMVLHIPAVPGSPSRICTWTVPVLGANLTISPTLCQSLQSRAYVISICVNGRKLAPTRTGSTGVGSKGTQIWDVKLSVGMNCVECLIDAETRITGGIMDKATRARERIAVLVFIK